MMKGSFGGGVVTLKDDTRKLVLLNSSTKKSVGTSFN